MISLEGLSLNQAVAKIAIMEVSSKIVISCLTIMMTKMTVSCLKMVAQTWNYLRAQVSTRLVEMVPNHNNHHLSWMVFKAFLIRYCTSLCSYVLVAIYESLLITNLTNNSKKLKFWEESLRVYHTFIQRR